MNDPVVVTMRGPNDLDIRTMSNFEAGITLLSAIGHSDPSLTFGKLANYIDSMGDPRLAGVFDFIGRQFSNVISSTGDILKSTKDVVGGTVGDAVRLVTDKQVIDGVSKLGSAYATGGASGALSDLGGGGGGGGDTGNSALDSLIGFISSLGQQVKNSASGNAPPGKTNWVPWAIGGAAVLGVVLVVKK